MQKTGSQEGEFEQWWEAHNQEQRKASRTEDRHMTARVAYAAGQASGPTCHKCGKLVETGDVLCTEHELEVFRKLAAIQLTTEQVHDALVLSNMPSDELTVRVLRAQLNVVIAKSLSPEN